MLPQTGFNPVGAQFMPLLKALLSTPKTPTETPQQPQLMVPTKGGADPISILLQQIQGIIGR